MSPAPAGGKLRAWLEVLRAPLLLSPIADVLAGWCVGLMALREAGVAVDPFGERALRPLLSAVLAGCCLLAAGMAQNSLCDLADDRLRKPDRPLPRGALTRGEVFGAWTLLAAAALVLAAITSTLALIVAVAILLGSSAYNLGLKHWRIPGCALLGLLRGLDLWLGVVALAGFCVSEPGGFTALTAMPPLLRPLIALAAYALYVFVAALHASTDDEPAGAHPDYAAIAQVALLLATLAALGHAPWFEQGWPLAGAIAATALLAWATWRVIAARRTGPAPHISGALLSNFVLVTGALAAFLGTQPTGLVVAGLAVLLLRVSRAFLRIVPPT